MIDDCRLTVRTFCNFQILCMTLRVADSTVKKYLFTEIANPFLYLYSFSGGVYRTFFYPDIFPVP